MKEFLLKKLKQYSSIASSPRNEEHFANFIQEDFSTNTQEQPEVSRKVYRNGKLYYYFLAKDLTQPYFFTVHLDRVWDYVNTIQDDGDFLVGQLDDIIGIAILRYLYEQKIPLNILFTTVEEYADSWHQLEEIIKLYPKLRPISIDIDVFHGLDELVGDFISLRDFDRIGKFDLPLVNELRNIAQEEKIPFCTNYNGWAFVETACLEHHTGLKGAHIGIPIINYHSDKETARWGTIFNCIKLTQLFIHKITERKVTHESYHKKV